MRDYVVYFLRVIMSIVTQPNTHTADSTTHNPKEITIYHCAFTKKDMIKDIITVEISVLRLFWSPKIT